MTNLK
ncbi:unnamed protein product [Cuscuta epithymum]|jgi:uncharacterized membrane protein